MIGRLRGELVSKKPPMLLIDVAGVGYEVLAPMSTFYDMADGEPITIITHFVVREDQQTLYGFSSEKERELFRTLIKVSGVGPKLALTILSGIEAEQFVQVINQNDVASLVRVPGIGKKTAERLAIYILKTNKDLVSPFSDAIINVKNQIDFHLDSYLQ